MKKHHCGQSTLPEAVLRKECALTKERACVIDFQAEPLRVLLSLRDRHSWLAVMACRRRSQRAFLRCCCVPAPVVDLSSPLDSDQTSERS